MPVAFTLYHMFEPFLGCKRFRAATVWGGKLTRFQFSLFFLSWSASNEIFHLYIYSYLRRSGFPPSLMAILRSEHKQQMSKYELRPLVSEAITVISPRTSFIIKGLAIWLWKKKITTPSFHLLLPICKQGSHKEYCSRRVVINGRIAFSWCALSEFPKVLDSAKYSVT